MKNIFYAIIILGMIFLAQFCVAQTLKNPLKVSSFPQLVDEIAKIVMQVGGVAAVIMIIWSGFLFVSARGNEEQLKKAKATFQWTIIGAILLLGSSAIAQAVVNFVKELH